MKKIVLMTFMYLSATLAHAQTAPDVLVKNVATEVIAIIKNDKEIQTGNQKKMGEIIDTKVSPHFNVTRMTALAMGRNWSKATPEQQKKLTDEFRGLLIRTYSSALANYKDNTIDYKPLRAKPEDSEVVVRTQVLQTGSSPVPIDYSMMKTSDGWKAYDVVVGGVSLVTNYRDEFNQTIRESGVDGLIKVLADKNKAASK